MEKEAKTPVTQQTCDDAKAMIEAGMKQKDIGRILHKDASTISKIKTAGYNLEAYLKLRRESNSTKKEPNVELVYDPSIAEEYRREQAAKAEEIAGQIEMELTTVKPEMSEQTKMMRFQASQVDKLIMKLDQIYNMASMILRVVRKE